MLIPSLKINNPQPILENKIPQRKESSWSPEVWCSSTIRQCLYCIVIFVIIVFSIIISKRGRMSLDSWVLSWLWDSTFKQWTTTEAWFSSFLFTLHPPSGLSNHNHIAGMFSRQEEFKITTSLALSWGLRLHELLVYCTRDSPQTFASWCRYPNTSRASMQLHMASYYASLLSKK